MSELTSVFNHSIIITIFVFVMMLLIDYINVFTKGKMRKTVKGGKGRQYLTASFLGATPGCLGAFMNVSFYVHGLLSFGAIVGGMIATSGDEAFVMLALFPKKALFLFALLFILGIAGAWISDKIASRLKIVPCAECQLQKVHDIDKKHYFQPSVLKKFPLLSHIRYGLILFFVFIILLNLSGVWGPQSWDLNEPARIILISLSGIAVFISATVSEHYLKDHIWGHIVKKHIWKVFLWTFFAMLFVTIGLQYWNLEEFVISNIGWILIISAIVGLIPESGPHMVFVMMYANGLVPFSILLTSSIVQDGHGMLPLLSYTVKDSVLIKLFNLIFALVIGVTLYALGL
jgi:hypothetical protein